MPSKRVWGYPSFMSSNTKPAYFRGTQIEWERARAAALEAARRYVPFISEPLPLRRFGVRFSNGSEHSGYSEAEAKKLANHYQDRGHACEVYEVKL